jgi:UrcA family protein
MTLPKALVSIALATSVTAMVPAFAATSDAHVKTQSVSILGYDLSDRADAERVLSKIESAAERVCTLSTARVTIQERKLRQQCAEKAIDIAVKSLKSPTLSEALIASRES